MIVVDVNGKTLDLIDAIRTGDGLAGRVDPDTPLIVLTARIDELHRIRALDRGGDDVLAKPHSYPELRARIAAVLRRAQARRAPRILRVGELRIDITSRTVKFRDSELALPAKEYELLRTLASEPSRVFTREELLKACGGTRTAARARSTATRADYGGASAMPAPRGSFGASGEWAFAWLSQWRLRRRPIGRQDRPS